MAPPNDLFLGVDGGGTGCRARLESEEGRVLGRGTAGPAATRFGVEQSWRAIHAACMMALAEAGLGSQDCGRIHVGVGVAGLGRKGALAALSAVEHPFASIHFANDSVTACLGAHDGADGGIVIVGTGSGAHARIGGNDIRLGGYGFPISDEGSGADLGLSAMRLAMQAVDGRIPVTPLLGEIIQHFGGDPLEATSWADNATATDYATFAPLVLRHAKAGDGTARLLVDEISGKVEALVDALCSRGVPRISLVGGLAGAIEAWLSPGPRSALVPAKGDAVSGAMILAGRPPAGVGQRL